MFDIYKSYKTMAIDNVDEAVIDKFAAWAYLNEVRELDINVKAKFFEETFGVSENIIEKILEDERNKLSYLYLYSTDFTEIIFEETDPDVRNNGEEISIDSLDLERIKNKLKIKVDQPRIYIDSSLSSEYKFHYFSQSGSLLILPINYKDLIESKVDYLEVFKSLADSTRLAIIDALKDQPKTSKELSEATGVSLSTINHHLSTLMETGLVSLHIDSKEGKGARYIYNKDNFENYMNNFMKGF